MNSKLSKRLLVIANMIEDDKVVYDVGCDHAYLDIYLTQNRSAITCIAIDLRPSVVDIAKKNIKERSLNIPVLLNNGLENIELQENAVVVLAGMGTRTILKIIKDKKIPEMIIQSNDDLILLRDQLSKSGYKIIDEKVIYESGYYYVFIKTVLGKSCYSEEDLILGPVLKNSCDNVYHDYLSYLVKKYDKMIYNIPSSFFEKAKELIKYKKSIETFLRKIKMT